MASGRASFLSLGLLQLARLYSDEDNSGNAVLAYQAIAKMLPESPQAAEAREALEKP